MAKRSKHRQPTALTIAGSDSGGGAGIQADVRVFSALGVHATTVITAVTAQNPDSVTAVQGMRPAIVQSQLEAVFSGFDPKVIKTGMLHRSEVIRVVADFVRLRKVRPIMIVDPVMVATSGTRLLNPRALSVMQKELLPLAMLVTPNLAEAEVLTGMGIETPEQMRTAARLIRAEHGCAVLIKGGHLPRMKEAVDLFYDGEEELILAQPLQRGVRTHGTGCTYAAAIAAFAAHGERLRRAIELAKHYVTEAIARSVRVSRYRVLNHFWRFE